MGTLERDSRTGIALLLDLSRFISLTLSAYLSVFKEFSQHDVEGEMFAIMTDTEWPVKDSLKTSVNFEPLKGMCFEFWSKALMHSFSASKLLLICAPSILVCLLLS